MSSNNHTILWSNTAERDLTQIIEYIATNKPKVARKNLRIIKNKVTDLKHFPERGRIVPELKEHGILLYQEIIIKPWRIIYKIENQQIYILSVIDSRRNLEDILWQRFIN